MLNTKISTFDSTWNPITGCRHDCPYCYARRIAERFGKQYPDRSAYYMENGLHILDSRFEDTPYPFGFEPTYHYYKLNEFRNKKGRNIFVCSMSDMFGRWIPEDWICEIFEACKKAPQHNYMFLTKNPSRYIDLLERDLLPDLDNMWFGTTVTDPYTPYAWFEKGGAHTFLSIEPIMEDFGRKETENLPEWVVVGAETGNRKNRVIPKYEWLNNLIHECRENHIPIFMKESLAPIWREPLIQEFPEELRKETK